MLQLGRSNTFVGRDFLDNTLLAPSGVGSYVVTALTPLHGRIYLTAPEESNPDKPPRERKSIDAGRVLQTLDHALQAVSVGLAQKTPEDSVQSMKSAVSVGVSQELVSGLAEFVSGHEAAVVVPSQLWTPGGAPREYTFEPKHTLVLLEAAAALAEETVSTQTTVTGVIAALRHEPNNPERTVQVFTTSPGPVRRVRVSLSEDDYKRAAEAHAEGEVVRISGLLTKVRKFWWLLDPTIFHVLTVAEEEAEESGLLAVHQRQSSPWTPFDFDNPRY